jgi:hypothetical protein
MRDDIARHNESTGGLTGDSDGSLVAHTLMYGSTGSEQVFSKQGDPQSTGELAPG